MVSEKQKRCYPIKGPTFHVKKTYEEVADYLKNQILTGVYKPGDRLPSIRELGETLGVGQSTVREAISALKTLGLVTMRQGEGTFVTRLEPEEVWASFEPIRPMSTEDVISLLEVRKIIEAGIVRLAAERRSDEDLRLIERSLDDMAAAIKTKSLGEKADWAFHYALAVASHNPILTSIMQSLAETISKSLAAARVKMYQEKKSAERLLAEHRAIYTAVAEKDPGKAEEAMLAHLRGVEQAMLA
nr:FadR/GntR family transcriptional regulator [Brevibacillus sp. SYP-B805]